MSTVEIDRTHSTQPRRVKDVLKRPKMAASMRVYNEAKAICN